MKFIMTRNLLKLLALVVILASSNALAQLAPGQTIQVDDGFGHYSYLKPQSTNLIFTLPPVNGGVILTYTPGVSPAWLTGGNTNPVSNVLGTLTADNLSIGSTNITRATFSATPSATTAMLTFQNTTNGIQGVRINGSMDATGASTLTSNPGVWDLVVDGD